MEVVRKFFIMLIDDRCTLPVDRESETDGVLHESNIYAHREKYKMGEEDYSKKRTKRNTHKYFHLPLLCPPLLCLQ